jgi:hypothetical protein
MGREFARPKMSRKMGVPPWQESASTYEKP